MVFTASIFVGLISTPAMAIGKCGSGARHTCVVDGDTMWLQGEKIRLMGYDTPETTTDFCGGAAERRLGDRATERLIQLLNDGDISISRDGVDRYGRTLAKVYLDGRNVGDVLIQEGLARSWPDGREFWCN